eukprot:TRINITY_DN3845_c0_g4_i2.p1 TRINITY_DN3845_c0_g4~~TRINITY_DN3845_c0_g4_i2.p1  ORF type:complete len:263 (+),score=29.68 TRINITY_DN3845_c0_g4_i2:199-987(+)
MISEHCASNTLHLLFNTFTFPSIGKRELFFREVKNHLGTTPARATSPEKPSSRPSTATTRILGGSAGMRTMSLRPSTAATRVLSEPGGSAAVRTAMGKLQLASREKLDAGLNPFWLRGAPQTVTRPNDEVYTLHDPLAATKLDFARRCLDETALGVKCCVLLLIAVEKVPKEFRCFGQVTLSSVKEIADHQNGSDIYYLLGHVIDNAKQYHTALDKDVLLSAERLKQCRNDLMHQRHVYDSLTVCNSTFMSTVLRVRSIYCP